MLAMILWLIGVMICICMAYGKGYDHGFSEGYREAWFTATSEKRGGHYGSGV